MFIYKITNKINNKIYIGQTIGEVEKRWYKHDYISRNPDNREHSLIHRALAKHGKDNFIFEILDDSAKTQKQLNNLEIKYISSLNTLSPNGYNLQLGGSRGAHHESTKEKLKRAQHFPIDCKCMKTGVTYSFYNTGEVEELGFVRQTVLSAINDFRMSKGFYWKKRHEEFPKCIETWHRERFYRGNCVDPLNIEEVNKNIEKSRKEFRYRSDAKAVIDNRGTLYKSTAEAARCVGAYPAGIRAVVRGERRTAGGLSFRYATEEEIENYES